MAARRIRKRQRGAALLIFLLVFVTGVLGYAVSRLTPEAIEARRQQKNADVLVLAREVLLGYALKYRDEETLQGNLDRMYGYLPLPDLGSARNNNTGCTQEGCDANTPTGIACDANNLYPTIVGRFPWRTLGTGPLRDGHGECLWLIVSSLHLRKHCTTPTLPPMNWDTLGQFDIVTANGSATLASQLATAHDRPVAIIYAPGPPLPGQNRGTSASDSSDVRQCGGNYDAANYLDPALSLDTAIRSALNASNYLGGTHNASGSTGDSNPANDPDTPKRMMTEGRIFAAGGNLVANGCPQGDCTLATNDTGLRVTAGNLFDTIRKSNYYRNDINNLLASMETCLVNLSSITPLAMSILPTPPADKAVGKVPDIASCGLPTEPAGYFNHYREQTLVASVSDIADCKSNYATPGKCLDVVVDGVAKKCHGVLLLGGQRGPGQTRASQSDRNLPANYLEGNNLGSFTTTGQLGFAGAGQFRATARDFAAHQDVARCIPEAGYSAANPTGAPFVSVNSAALGAGQLTQYNTSTNTLTLGQVFTSPPAGGITQDLYGCAWRPETHAMGSGLRTYFKFRINDVGGVSAPMDGVTFAIVDADTNSAEACGSVQQHLGYSGNNLDTPVIREPKIGIEFDTRRNYRGTNGFLPTFANRLDNGRRDPNYTGGHVGIVYWGGTATINTGRLPPCTAPAFNVGGTCHLPAEEDDNVHAQPPLPNAACRPPPSNPSAPATPTAGAGVYKFDPNLSQVPVNRDMHVRLELTRTPVAGIALPTARVATVSTLDLAAPGAAIDGITLSGGDLVLVKNQTFPSENGIYAWNGAAIAMTRATDYDSTQELAGAIVKVAEGTQNALSTWRQSQVNPVLGIDNILWSRLQVRVATTANLNLGSPGTSIDRVPLANGDRVLVKNQNTAGDNGIYVWNGAAAAMTRVPDADSAAENAGLVVRIEAGEQSAASWWRTDNGSLWTRLGVRLATQANIDLASPGSMIDGCIVPVTGDRVLVKSQTSPAENGIYVWNGPAAAMARSTDADNAAELAGALVPVAEGTDMGRAWRQTALAATGTLGAGAVQWSALDPLAAPQFVIEAWILPDSITDANRIAAMKDTTRPMSLIAAGFSPHLRDAPLIYHPFRRARLGFTTGMRRATNDQTVVVSNFSTSWLD